MSDNAGLAQWRAHAAEVAEQRREQVADLTRTGRSAPEIAAILGISERQVQRHRRAAGCASEPCGPPMTEDEIRRAEQLLADGCSRKEVARTLGRSAHAIKKHFPDRCWTREQMREHIAINRRFRAMQSDWVGRRSA